MTPRLKDTWYCTECAKAGQPYVYVSLTKTKCPSGHKRKTGLSLTVSRRAGPRSFDQ